jgi:hypothetical protein
MAFERAKSLRDVFRVTDPGKPLESGDPRYVPCEKVRGNEDIVEFLLNTISWQEEGTYCHQLFTGHRGCGKSTELLRLKARLENAGYAVFYYEAGDDLDLYDVKYTDIILSIVRKITSEIKLDENLLSEVQEWFAETLYDKKTWQDVQRTLEAEVTLGAKLPKSLPIIARLLARVMGQIKSGEQVKHTIRLKLDPQVSQLIERANLLLREAQKKLKRRFVIIVDQLDRIVLKDKEIAGRTNHDVIYIDHGDQLCSLEAHLIYTIPISMFYSPHAPALKAIFPDYAVLPMIKSRTSNNQANKDGLEALREILGKRIVLEDIFTEDAIDYICKMSGGHSRDLLTLVRYATRYPLKRWPQPIDIRVATRAVGKLIAEYSRAIPEEHYPLLAQVHINKSIRNDGLHGKMLYNQSVLEYYNGAPPWHDVHPIVLELPKLRTALNEERKNRGIQIT